MEDFVTQQQVELLTSRGMGEADARTVLASFSPSSVHTDTALSNLAVSINNRDYIADGVLPVVRVNKPSDVYYVYNPDTHFELQTANLTGTEAMPDRVRYKISSSNYSTVPYGLMDFVSRREEAAADSPIQPRVHATKVVTNRLLLAREVRAAALAFATGSYGANTAALAGADRWDQSTSDPVQKIDDAIEACDERPNTLVLGAEVWKALRNHPKLKELILGRSVAAGKNVPLRVTQQLLAEAFDLDAVLVGRSKYRTNREGATSATSYVWGKFAALIKVDANPNPRDYSGFGVTFRFVEPGETPLQAQVIEAPLPGKTGGVYVKVTHEDDEVAVGGAYSGYLYSTVVS